MPMDGKHRMDAAIRIFLIAILVAAGLAGVSGLVYANWWAFNQKYPQASFWAWVAEINCRNRVFNTKSGNGA